MVDKRTHKSWDHMIQRCTNPNHVKYPRYGGRGITVCDRWRKFSNFLDDMGERPERMTIDRINNDGNYEPSNCRWATMSQQIKNQDWPSVCRLGHPFSGENLVFTKQGWRVCRTCNNERRKANKLKAKLKLSAVLSSP